MVYPVHVTKQASMMHDPVRPIEIKVMKEQCGNKTQYCVGNAERFQMNINPGPSMMIGYINAVANQSEYHHGTHGISKLVPVLTGFWKLSLNQKRVKKLATDNIKNHKREACRDKVPEQIKQEYVRPDLEE
jgi:hypothetical protein